MVARPGGRFESHRHAGGAATAARQPRGTLRRGRRGCQALSDTMRCLTFAAALCSLVLAACVTTANARTDAATAADSPHDAALTVDAGRLIVVTVDNSTQVFLSSPGSTPRGYATSGNYA